MASMDARSFCSSVIVSLICSSSSIFRMTVRPVRSDGVPEPRGIPVMLDPGGAAMVISMRPRRSY